MKLSENTLKLLAALEDSIDPETEDDYLSQWDSFISHDFKGDIFLAKRKKTVTVACDRPKVFINDALKDKELMLVSQLLPCIKMLESGKGVLGVRSNYGTGIMTSLFGAEIFVMPYETNTLPTTRAFGADRLDELVAGGIPDVNAGFGKDVYEMGEFFSEVFSRYPKIKKYVPIYHPDVQGPLDICEVLIGSEMFYLPYDDPDGFKALLGIVTETYKKFLDKWYEMVPKTPERSVHWGNIVHRGNIVLRDDSAMNLSPEMYAEFGLPYDSALLDYYDGGLIHFCGRGDHYIEIMIGIPKLYGINMSQPHLNDMEKIYRNTVDKGIQIVGFSKEYAEKYKGRPGGYGGNLSL